MNNKVQRKRKKTKRERERERSREIEILGVSGIVVDKEAFARLVASNHDGTGRGNFGAAGHNPSKETLDTVVPEHMPHHVQGRPAPKGVASRLADLDLHVRLGDIEGSGHCRRQSTSHASDKEGNKRVIGGAHALGEPQLHVLVHNPVEHGEGHVPDHHGTESAPQAQDSVMGNRASHDPS